MIEKQDTYSLHLEAKISILHLQTGGRFPRPNNMEDAMDVVKCAKALISSGEIVMDDFVLDEAFTMRYSMIDVITGTRTALFKDDI
jgi:hypothetical protein